MTTPEQAAKPAADTKVRTALIVEDNRVLNDAMRDFLTPLGFQVKQCHEGMQALGLVRDEKFDLIILEIRLPSVNGLQVAATARSGTENRNSIICIITGELDPVMKVKAEGLKIMDFLRKPVDFPALGASLKSRFAKSEKKVSYDLRVTSAFIDAAEQVYEFYFQEKPQRGKVHVRPDGQQPEKGFCTGLIALTGDGFVGSMGLSMTVPFIKNLATVLFQGVEVKLDDEFVSDLTGEMCNLVLGKVKLNFAKLGIKIMIGLPEVIMGQSHVIQHKVSNPVICVALGEEGMGFELQFVLSQQNVKETKDADIQPASVLMFE